MDSARSGEKVSVSGRRVFTPTNYNSKCCYAPSAMKALSVSFRKTGKTQGRKTRAAYSQSKQRVEEPRGFSTKRVKNGPSRRICVTCSRLTFAWTPPLCRVHRRILTVCRRKVITKPEPVPLEKVSDKKPRLNANARRPGP